MKKLRNSADPKVENASRKPQIFYGLHMVPGVAEYREQGAAPYRVLVNSKAIREMDATFPGCPLYVHHVPEVDLKNIQTEADGFVVESFFNEADGNHWAKFIVVSDEGHEAIKKKYKLSNSYFIRQKKPGGGEWHGVAYQDEVMKGEYEHLALVPNPRYAESIILTPEEFKAYNANHREQLAKLTNSKDKQGARQMKFNIFKKQKVENTSDLSDMLVTLPQSKKEMLLEEVIHNYDGYMAAGCYANGEHKVKVNEMDMSVNELISKYLDGEKRIQDMGKNVEMAEKDESVHANPPSAEANPLQAAKKENEDEDVSAKKKGEDEDKDKDDGEKHDNSKEPAESAGEKEKREEREKFFNDLYGAPEKAAKLEASKVIETSSDKLARGKTNY